MALSPHASNTFSGAVIEVFNQVDGSNWQSIAYAYARNENGTYSLAGLDYPSGIYRIHFYAAVGYYGSVFMMEHPALENGYGY